MFPFMHRPHHALAWPALDPDELQHTLDGLGVLAAHIRAGNSDPRPMAWRGQSANAHRIEFDRIRIGIDIVPEAIDQATTAVRQLIPMIQSTRLQISALAESLHTAESNAKTSQAVAESLALEATFAARTDPASLEESERLRQLAVHARHRAEDARRDADLSLRRAIDAAGELVEAIHLRDMLVAAHLDELLDTPRFGRITGAAIGHHMAIPADDRAWILPRIADTRSEIHRYVDSLGVAITEIEAVPWAERTWWESMALVHLNEKHALHRRFLSPGRQMLEWDPIGDGRAVEVFGDLARARHIAVVVPGIMNTIENFDDQLGRNAKDLWVGASAIDQRTAVVAWLGYDTPELVNAVSKGRAVEHEAELRSFVASLPGDAHVTVVAHSYGTVLAAESAAQGLAADDLVLLGSPGTRLDHAADADLEPDAQVFAGVSDTDWIVGRSGWGSVLCPEKIVDAGWLTGLRWLVSPVTGPLAWVTDSCKTDPDGDIKGLSHGLNPAHEDFGAVEISTADVDGHSSYMDPDSTSLDAVAQIVTGTHPDQR